MNILGVIPARMGSLRMPRKNLCEIEPGISLVQQAVNCSHHCGLISATVISSDDTALDELDAHFVKRPREISGPLADITDAVKHALIVTEAESGVTFDYVVTLQPAVIARSPLIVRNLVKAVTDIGLSGGLTMAYTHRWIWKTDGKSASNDWHGRPYPRSQDGGQRLVEINAVQVASREVVMDRKRWGTPLAILELPAWAAALDIDTPSDLAAARDLWPWAKPRLETWAGPIHVISQVTACA